VLARGAMGAAKSQLFPFLCR